MNFKLLFKWHRNVQFGPFSFTFSFIWSLFFRIFMIWSLYSFSLRFKSWISRKERESGWKKEGERKLSDTKFQPTIATILVPFFIFNDAFKVY